MFFGPQNVVVVGVTSMNVNAVKLLFAIAIGHLSHSGDLLQLMSVSRRALCVNTGTFLTSSKLDDQSFSNGIRCIHKM